MIRIASEITSTSVNGSIKHFIICPQCLAEDWFYNFAMKACPDCGFVWGKIDRLMDDVNVRKQFYIDGEINV
jgi:hypothetical protein